MKFIEHINKIDEYVFKKKEENRQHTIAGDVGDIAVEGRGFSTMQVNAYQLGNTTHVNTIGNGTIGHMSVTQTPFGMLINR